MKPWKRISEEKFKFGHRKMLRRVFEMPGGRESEFHLYGNGLVVCVLALTPENRVVIARQFRPAQERILDELPGGGVEEGETPLEAVKREMLEETGYTGEFSFVSQSLSSAYDTLIRYNFVAVSCRRVQEPTPPSGEDEHVEVVEMELEDFRKHLRTPNLTDVATGYLGLDYLKLL